VRRAGCLIERCPRIARAYLFLILLVYGLLIVVLCFIGRWPGRHPLVLKDVDRRGPAIVPAVFVVLRIYILIAG